MMGFDELEKEQQVMVVMRKVLTSVIREITPAPGKEYPLSEQTVEDIKMCLKLISTREQELAKEKGITNLARPHYADEEQTVKTVSFGQVKKGEKGKEE
ncbi:segregation and condensation protein A [Candidatus Parabeggiatoa sp. HSG14]|uniref:segregation and condensation protein A n=1 Tax=Candidatus Parabeggiatoa sp. HSG14 TaxID=3055593 RepID=UPI0025A86F03|nr:segregation and condensation protein A [Thiotrichales bacterium HSG14]